MKNYKIWVQAPPSTEAKRFNVITEFRLEKEIEAESLAFACVAAKDQFPYQTISVQEGGYRVQLDCGPLDDDTLADLTQMLADSEWK